jgi:5-methylcytosine-specific restriction protein B
MVGVIETFQGDYSTSVKEEQDPYVDDLGISMETWLDLLQNRAIFQENDLIYLNNMYELGGEATPTQLAAALGKHFSSFNTPVVQLAKRILKATDNIATPTRKNGTNRYWSVLFEGEYTENHHFIWRLKQELKEAMAAIQGDKEAVI